MTLHDESERPEWLKAETNCRPEAFLDGQYETLASPIYASWNQLYGWLRVVDGLRRAA